MKVAIAKAVEVMRQFPEASHRETVEHLATILGDAELAERLVEFVPIAFSRVALANSGINFQETFCRSLGNGKFSHYCPLSAEPVWEPALAVSQEEQPRDISEADRLAVLARCAIFNSAAQAIAAGHDLTGSATSPYTLLRPAPMPCDPKPWWQFWM